MAAFMGNLEVHYIWLQYIVMEGKIKLRIAQAPASQLGPAVMGNMLVSIVLVRWNDIKY